MLYVIILNSVLYTNERFNIVGQIPGLDGSLCPLWCQIECNANQIKCPGQEDENGCKETDVCIDRAVGDDGQLCPGYCPSECDVQAQHSCFTPPENGCPQAPSCEQKQTDAAGHTCDEQHCPVTCSEDEACFPGEQNSNGCYGAAVVVPIKKNDLGYQCAVHRPKVCDPLHEVKCDADTIQDGTQIGCETDEICKPKERATNGEFCPDESDSHGCPITCPEDHEKCPTRTLESGCKEQARCTPCKKDKNGECCPTSSNCPALCQPHQRECIEYGEDDNGCPLPRVCVDVTRDYYGDLCPVYCPGKCEKNQIRCEGQESNKGCPSPPFCVPVPKKLWGDDDGEWCPAFCPVYCKEWEQLCESVQDPCDGCPTEAVCKPKAKDENGIYCPVESASHGCDISCKTLDGLETICAAYDDPAAPGCKERLTCLARPTGNDGRLCPSLSVCPKKCARYEKQCATGYDEHGCKLPDACIAYPVDDIGQQCLDFECPPKCDEEVEKYCQGAYKFNSLGQLCPERDYCIDRPLDKNGNRCPGHCDPTCVGGFQLKSSTGVDKRGCPLAATCEAIAA